MNITETSLPGLLVVKPNLFEDERGYFYESYNTKTFEKIGITSKFVQDNQARSGYGVIRGLHYQLNPHAQAKLIRVISGEILDVVVDIREGSPTFGQSEQVRLDDVTKAQLFIPRGFAHGYMVLSQSAEIFYKCDNLYAPASERGIHYNDPALRIDWPLSEEQIIVSGKDMGLPNLADSEHNFEYAEN